MDIDKDWIQKWIQKYANENKDRLLLCPLAGLYSSKLTKDIGLHLMTKDMIRKYFIYFGIFLEQF
jgi:hypothetical protein